MGHRNRPPCDPTLPQLPSLAAPRSGSVRRASGFVQAGFTSKWTGIVNAGRLPGTDQRSSACISHLNWFELTRAVNTVFWEASMKQSVEERISELENRL